MATGTATKLIRLFKAPGGGNFLALIKKGDTVDVVRPVTIAGTGERWLEVNAGARHGFLKAQFVQVDGEGSPAAPEVAPVAGPVPPKPAPSEPEAPKPPKPSAGPAGPLEPSGPAWVARFPDGGAISALSDAFRPGVEAFIKALKAAGATVSVASTRRPRERAYLMHHAWRISKKILNPDNVPAMDGVGIAWVHLKNGAMDLEASRAAATAMVKAYGIKVQPALNGRHVTGDAIDMSIAWSGTLRVKGPDGGVAAISSTPRTGENDDLRKVGKAYRVIKLVGDPPHWSTDGH